MHQLSTAASFRLDDGPVISFSIERTGDGLRLNVAGQTTKHTDGEELLLRILQQAPSINENESEDVRNLVSHQLTCLEYFGGPKEER